MNTYVDPKLELEKKNAEIMAMNISNEDKRILLNYYYNEYKIKKQQIQFNNLFNFEPLIQQFPQIPAIQPLNIQNHVPKTNYTASAYSFTQHTNPDGTVTVREHNKTNNNGHVDAKYNHYKVDSNGNKTYFR
jgi:hypothetical protein